MSRIPRQRQPLRDLTLAERFIDFHRANPDVYALLVKSCHDYRRATGHEKWGIAPAMERVRWVLTVDTTRTDGFKLNATHAAFYARLIMASEPSLAGIFDLRAAEADDDTSWIAEATR